MSGGRRRYSPSHPGSNLSAPENNFKTNFLTLLALLAHLIKSPVLKRSFTTSAQLIQLTRKQVLQHFSVGQEVHVFPADPRLEGSSDGLARAEDGVVNQLLVGAELARDGVGAGDVRAEPIVRRAHVEQNDVLFPEMSFEVHKQSIEIQNNAEVRLKSSLPLKEL